LVGSVVGLVPVERPALRNPLALSHRHHDAAAHDGGEREVDDHGRAFSARKGRRDRVGAEKRLLATPGRDRRR